MKPRKSLVALQMLLGSYAALVASADSAFVDASSLDGSRKDSLTESEKLVISLAIVGHAMMLNSDIMELEKARRDRLVALEAEADKISHDSLGDIPGLLQELGNLKHYDSKTGDMFEQKARVVSAKLKALN